MPRRQTSAACARALQSRCVNNLWTARINRADVKPRTTTRAFVSRTQHFATPLSNTVTQSRDVPPVAEPQQDPVTETAAARTRSRSATAKVQEILQGNPGSMTETYRAFAVTERMYLQCAKQADYNMPEAEKNEPIPETPNGEHLGVGEGWWHEVVKLEPTFSTWAHVTFLHMWIVTTRIRRLLPESAPLWQQHLTDHFFYDAEDRMNTMHGLVMSTTRSKYLKDLFDQWRGAIAAYDEGFMRGDTVLAAAIWRNVFKGDASTKPRDLAIVVSHVRKMLWLLDRLNDENLSIGKISFTEPEVEARHVDAVSWRMSEPLEDPVDTNREKT